MVEVAWWRWHGGGGMVEVAWWRWHGGGGMEMRLCTLGRCRLTEDIGIVRLQMYEAVGMIDASEVGNEEAQK